MFGIGMRVLAAVGYIGELGETDGVVTTYQNLIPHFCDSEVELDLVAYGRENEIREVAPGTRLLIHKATLPVRVDPDRTVDPALPFSSTWRLVKKTRYDVVQSSTPDPLGYYALRIARGQRIPFLALFHTVLDEYARIRLSRQVAPWVGNIAGTVMNRWMTWYYRQAQLVLAPSECVAEGLRARLGVPVGVLSRGVDTDDFNPKHRDRDDDRVRVLYVGRVAPEKSLAVLERFFKSQNEADLTIVGNGPYLEPMKQSLPLATFTGKLTGKELRRAYASADIFAFPSKTDTLGNVVLEANSSGIPAVVTDEMGPKELVKDGVTGFVTGSEEEFTQKLGLLISDHELRRNMGLAARAEAGERTWGRVFGRLVGYYETLLKETDPATGRLLPKDAKSELELHKMSQTRLSELS